MIAPTVVIENSADGQIDGAIGVEIPERCNKKTEQIAVIENSGEIARGIADLLVHHDLADSR